MSLYERTSRFARSLYRLFLFVADYSILLVQPRRSTTRNDVLIVQPDKLGDFVVWMDAARDYRACFPGRKLTLLVGRSWVELAQQIHFWDEVWAIDFQRFGEDLFYRLKLLARVRRHGFQEVVLVSRNFRNSDVMVRLSAAPVRIGPNGNENLVGRLKALTVSDKWFTQVVSLPERRKTTALALNLQFLQALGGERTVPELPRLPSDLGNSSPFQEQYIVLGLGADDSWRRWPLSCFAELVERIAANCRFKVVLCGVSSERELGASFCQLLSAETRTRVTNQIGNTNLLELTGLLRGAVAVISNETGTLHLASAVDTPAVCIAGGGDFGYLVPYPEGIENCGRPLPVTVYHMMPCYGCGWRCIYDVTNGEPMPCVASVGVEGVWTAFTSVIANVSELAGDLGHD